MRKLVVLALLAVIAGCGAEVAGTAAVTATARKKEMEEHKDTAERARSKVEKSLQSSEQNIRREDK